MKRYLSLLILLMVLLPIHVLAYSLSSASAVEHCKTLESENKEIIKRLKKTMGATSVNIEKWKDGNTYYIIRKGEDFARADMDGQLITYCDWNGQNSAFFRRIEIEKVGNIYITVVVPLGSTEWTRVWTSGNILDPNFEKIKSYHSNQDNIYAVTSGKGYNLYHLDGEKMNNYPLKRVPNFNYQQITVNDSRGLPYTFNVPNQRANIVFYEGTGATFLSVMLHKDVRHELRNQLIFPGGLLSCDIKSNGFAYRLFARELIHNDQVGNIVQTDKVLSMEPTDKCNLKDPLTNEIVQKDVVKFAYISGTDYIITEVKDTVTGVGFKGLINAADMSTIPAIFHDVMVTSEGRIMVRAKITDAFEAYDPLREYFPSKPEIAYEQLWELAKNDAAKLTPSQKEILAANMADQLTSEIASLDYNIKLMDNDKAFTLAIPSIKFIYYPETKTYGINGSEKIENYRSAIQNVDYNSDRLLAILNQLKVKIEDMQVAYNANLSRKEARDLAAKEAQRKKEEHEEKMKKIQERIAKLDAFKAQLNEAQSIVNEGKTRVAAKKSQSVSSGSNAGGGKSVSSAQKEDTSDRKAFLKGQIADWKNKLSKAEASYREAVSGGDDTWEKKRVIDSKRKTVDECIEMIRQYEAELNSL